MLWRKEKTKKYNGLSMEDMTYFVNFEKMPLALGNIPSFINFCVCKIVT